MEERLADLGEFGLIDRIRRLIEQEGVEEYKNLELGIGDDTASFMPRVEAAAMNPLG